jgi:hypothetical protein
MRGSLCPKAAARWGGWPSMSWLLDVADDGEVNGVARLLGASRRGLANTARFQPSDSTVTVTRSVPSGMRKFRAEEGAWLIFPAEPA